MKIRFILEFAWFYGVAGLREGIVYSIARMSLPLTLLFIFAIISHGALIPYAIAGGIVSIVAAESLTTASDAAFHRIEIKLQDLLVATPIGPVDYMLGMTLGNIIFSIPGIIVYLLLGFYFNIYTLIGLIETAFVVLLLALSTNAFAFALSSFVAHVRNVWGATTILSLALTILPPIFYPYTVLPAPLLYLFSLSPATVAAIAVQGFYGLSPFNIYAVYVLVIESVLYFFLSMHFVKWREG